jgi:hypothetical protein
MQANYKKSKTLIKAILVILPVQIGGGLVEWITTTPETWTELVANWPVHIGSLCVALLVIGKNIYSQREKA